MLSGTYWTETKRHTIFIHYAQSFWFIPKCLCSMFNALVYTYHKRHVDYLKSHLQECLSGDKHATHTPVSCKGNFIFHKVCPATLSVATVNYND